MSGTDDLTKRRYTDLQDENFRSEPGKIGTYSVMMTGDHITTCIDRDTL